jgi:endoglucanase
MAYSLCEAGRLWHVDRYSKLGPLLAARIAKEETATVPGVGIILQPGSQGFHPTPTGWYVNPSYLPPFLLQYFAHNDPSSPWKSVLASLPSAVQTSGGFAMDWMSVTADTGLAPSAPPATVAALPAGQTGPTPIGSYDAIRVYLWLGMSDPKTPFVSQTLHLLPGMANYLSHNMTPPLQVGPEGQALNPNGPAGFSAAVIPYLHVLGHKADEKNQADRLAALLDPATGLYGHEGMYYDQNLVLFEEGWNSGRFRFDGDGSLHVKWK